MKKYIQLFLQVKNVIADRYSDSTLAYQGGGRGLDIKWLIELNRFATNNLNPDVTFLLDLHPNEALNRRGNDNDRIEKAGFKLQMKVRNSYLEIAKLFDDRIVIIDGHQNQNAIHTEILNELNRRKIIS